MNRCNAPKKHDAEQVSQGKMGSKTCKEQQAFQQNRWEQVSPGIGGASLPRNVAEQVSRGILRSKCPKKLLEGNLVGILELIESSMLLVPNISMPE